MRNPSSKHAAGFSLLEVLVAVVLLATGLLALAALQGSLARSSAEAKVRSRIVALMSAEMDNVRSLPYTNLVSAAKVESTNPDCAAPANDVELAGCEAALGYVSLTRTVTPFGANAGNTTFVEGAAPVGSSEAEFRNVVVEVQWRDRNNDLQTLRTRTVVSSLALDSNSPIVDDESANHDPQKPVVRQASPVTAGMIPIALGNGDATAASNPMPEEVGKKGNTKISTRFTVLTYTPESGNLAIIQDRVETEVLKCKCQYGAGGTNLGTIYQQSQWPAIWTGTRYDVYVPENATAAPGQQYRSGPVSSAVQSAMCQECCRDRHDNPADTTNAKFDPEATGGAYQKYDMNSAGQLTNAGNTVSAQYVEACRVIRVDGMWRTAADMYMRQFGYLETETNVYQADTGLPTATATTRYTAYVKDYLSQYDGTVATAPTNAQTMYDDTTRGLNEPATVTIASSTDTKSRFMHARGVYVDYLEKQARETLADALASRRKNGQCLAGSTELADCVLPYLPFSTINVTEFADYESSNTSVIDVHTGGFLPWPTSNLPSRGATEAKGTGTANNRSSMRRSNSGLAATELLANGGIPGATDNLGDDAVGTDLQSFTVGGGTPSGGDSYYIRSTGMTSTSPAYTTTINSSDAKTCISSGTDYICTPTNTIFPGNGTLVLGNYWKQLEPGFSQTKADVLFRGSVCTKSYDNGTKDPLPTFTDQTFNIAVPIFQNYRLVSATMGSGSGTLTPGAPDQDNTTKETTTISILGITKDARIDLVFALENTRTDATPAACNVHYDKQSKTWSGSVSAWNYPWNP
ncbi:prepilin-type N-terminal cleavage/methylation domain-containing protein [Lysobacter sp. A6]|uniref:Prepilin-type N-terminal cleavage/methylation domain-containing protein n=1 Tax=Noviluteimonas lactosilytica TaxID=2888523 RepID=A0ABS8JJT6_9GAMM|nr:prepilin-type N-terminal cleavage/methylation domain-containing protein [Lysobacter lactosilyticus]MCC8363863.1 prepilin-type N-terminal cleavage/methylation domain-containing protein [Lysobacter lactosilyticus]